MLTVAPAPLILGFVVSAEDWRWTQYVTLMVAFAAYLLGIGVPETYPREILRMRARRAGSDINLPKAESGVTLGEMAQTTLFTPLAMAVSEPLVIMITLYLSLNFAVLFQWVSQTSDRPSRRSQRIRLSSTELDPAVYRRPCRSQSGLRVHSFTSRPRVHCGHCWRFGIHFDIQFDRGLEQ